MLPKVNQVQIKEGIGFYDDAIFKRKVDGLFVKCRHVMMSLMRLMSRRMMYENVMNEKNEY